FQTARVFRNSSVGKESVNLLKGERLQSLGF
ncbi:MAG: hypothetical protein ACJAR1_001441, partial [Rubritalea sp.]